VVLYSLVLAFAVQPRGLLQLPRRGGKLAGGDQHMVKLRFAAIHPVLELPCPCCVSNIGWNSAA
jgi:hypothetical protein